jgi:hypothetical protein
MTAGTPLGIQLYSVRDDLGPAQLDDTFARLVALGFTHVEPYDILGDTAGLEAALRRSGLRAATAHANVVTLDETAILDAAERLGIETVLVPWVDPASIADRAGVEKLAAAVNASAGRAAERGIRIGYHNHDFEFAQRIDGTPAYELFVELLDPAVVLELDVYWAESAAPTCSSCCRGSATGSATCTSCTTESRATTGRCSAWTPPDGWARCWPWRPAPSRCRSSRSSPTTATCTPWSSGTPRTSGSWWAHEHGREHHPRRDRGRRQRLRRVPASPDFVS